MADAQKLAERFREAGNEAVAQGKLVAALKYYSDAIAANPQDALTYSNRSAVFVGMQRFDQALADAEVAIKLNPASAKAFARKGAALSRMDKHEEALMAYMEAFYLEPTNNEYKEFAKMERKILMGSGQAPQLNPFGDPDAKQRLLSNPVTAAHMQQPDFQRIFDELHREPKQLGKYLEDNRVMDALGTLLGVDMTSQQSLDPNASEKKAAPPSAAAAPNAPKGDEAKSGADGSKQVHKNAGVERKEEIQKPLTDLQKKALEQKELGNAAYKKKDFATALTHYGKAVELDATNITFRTNRAAVYYEQKEYDKCIEECQTAVEIGREHRSDFKLIAKALARIGNAYAAKEDYKNAIAFYNKSLSEHRAPDIVKKVNEIEKKVKEMERLAYIDPEKSIEEKTKGNECFTKGDYPTALKHYTEAIRRNPDDAKLFSNRAACYTKLLEFNMALKDSEECIRLDPAFLKGYLRKGATLLALKKLTQAQSAYEKALELHPNHPEAMEGYKKCMMEQHNPEAVKSRAMQDPEVQQILGDPAMQLILQQMQKDPKALQEHLQNPDIAAKIQKLMDCGLIGIRHA